MPHGAHLAPTAKPDTQSLTQERVPDEKITISLCYFEELKLTEIAEVLNVSVSRVSQLHSKAMLRLRASVISIHENY